MHNFWVYLAVMAGVTYLIRLVPLLLFKKKITNRFVVSFLYYVPYAVLAAMTVPAIFYATSDPVSAFVGFAVALLFAYFKRSLLTVALASCLSVLITELLLKFII